MVQQGIGVACPLGVETLCWYNPKLYRSNSSPALSTVRFVRQQTLTNGQFLSDMLNMPITAPISPVLPLHGREPAFESI
jgi:hypothetical protein